MTKRFARSWIAVLPLAVLTASAPALARLEDPSAKTAQSPLASEFAAGIAAGRIDLVAFAANSRCMQGRTRKNSAEIAALIAKSKTPSATEAEFCGPTLRGYLFKSENPRALLLAVHGMQSNAAWFLSGDHLAANGIEVLAFDRRGSGMSDGIKGHVKDTNEFMQDMTGAVEFLRNKRRDVPLHLHANCFGTRIAIPYMQENMERATREVLQEEALAANPNLSPSELDYVSGFKFASVINTSPATHMSFASEKLIRDREKCFMQYLVKDGHWGPRKTCYAKKYDDLKILENGAAEFTGTELICLVNFVKQEPQNLLDTGCQRESLEKILDPNTRANLNEADKQCLDNTALLNNEWIAKNDCSAEDIAALKGILKDPEGVELTKSPLTDDMFTTEPHFLKLVNDDKLAVREISRSFFFAVDLLTRKMNGHLKGQTLPNRNVVPNSSAFPGSVLMVLARQDVMVYNDDIAHEYFQALRGIPSGTEDLSTLNDCYACNPRIVGKDKVDPARCVAEKLLACKFPQDVLECVDPKGELVGCDGGDGKVVSCKNPTRPFVRCPEVRLIRVREPRFPVRERAIKKLVEIECEHFMEFCKDRGETERYRKAMTDWLLLDRWQEEWRENFE